MPIDKTIFGLRFRHNEAFQPTQEELRAFIESPKKAGGRELHDSDLAQYRELLKGIQAFERGQRKGAAPLDFRGEIIYGVLNHTHLVTPTLQSAVEHFKYYVNVLQTLDFRKPTAFIKAVEEEMAKLNPKKKDDAVKIARFRSMINERNETILTLRKRWKASTEELTHLAAYIRNNLVKVAKLCDASIGVLADSEFGKKQQNVAIEDIKANFKESLRDRLHQGRLTKEDLETVKNDVAVLSKEITELQRENVSALTKMYDAVRNYALNSAREIDKMLAKIESTKTRSVDDDKELFAEAEQQLVSLLTGFHFELEQPELRRGVLHEELLLGKRKDMLDSLFALLQEERRSWTDRRTGEDRRIFSDPYYNGPERRTGKNRRSGRDRRNQ